MYEFMKANGLPCAQGNDCESNRCVEGVCCDGQCNGNCESCLAIYNGGVDGTCGFITAGLHQANSPASSPAAADVVVQQDVVVDDAGARAPPLAFAPKTSPPTA